MPPVVLAIVAGVVQGVVEWLPIVGEETQDPLTMGCGDQCPVIPGKRYVDWDVPDPKGLPPAEVRCIRDGLRRRVQDLIKELDRP